MLEGMNRKVTHKITGTRRGVAVSVKLEAPASLEIEEVMDKIEAFIKNQIDASVPKAQEKMPLDKPKRRVGAAPKKDGRAAAAGRSAQ